MPAVTSFLAAIVLATDAPGKSVLNAVVSKLKSEGVRVGGYVQRTSAHPEGAGPAGDVTGIFAEDIETGETFAIMRPRGGAGSGCRLDSSVLAELAGRALLRLDRDIDLFVLNRFGRTETEGGGLRAAYEKAIECGVPVLTSVKPEYIEGWKTYTGDLSMLLPPDESVILDWCRSVLEREVGS